LVLQEASLLDISGHGRVAIEKIITNETEPEEIRLSYAEKNSKGFFQTTSRPLEAVEDDIYELIKMGIENRIISAVLQAGLKTVIRSIEPGRQSVKALYTSPGCDVYARAECYNADHILSVERIFLPGINLFTLRFSMGQKDLNGIRRMIPAPPHMREEDFLYLFQAGLREGVFSKVFTAAVLSIL